MSGESGPGGGRTIFRPSPLQNARDVQTDSPALPAPSAQPILPHDDVPSPPVPPRYRNVMMTQAAPILARIAAQRTGRLRMPLKDLHREMTEEISAFGREISQVYPAEYVNTAQYALCATVDDIALSLPDQGADAGRYAQRNMVYQFFNDNSGGGDQFVVLLNQMLEKPDAYQDLLELFHACLAAGFGGRIRVAGGQEASQSQMQAVLAALQHPRDLTSTELSPRWRGVNVPARTTGVWGGVGLVAAIAAGGLLLIFLVLKFALALSSDSAATALRQIFPSDPVSVAAPAGAVPLAVAPSAQLDGIRACLTRANVRGVTVDQGPSTVWVRTVTSGQGSELFRAASADLEPEAKGLLTQIARCVDDQPGAITVVGYTDTDQIHSLRFADNQQLSEARAMAAAQVVRGALRDGSRVKTEGRGAQDPIAAGDPADAKRLSRRVEVLVQRVD